MRKIASLLIILLFLSSAFAGTTGKIAGVISDKRSGESLTGVNVIIQDLAIGASTDINGEYFIINVPAGSHTITVAYMGYKTIEYEGIKVQPDRTLGVNFALEETVIDIGEVIVVEAERERIQKDLTMSSQYVDSDEMKMLPIESYEQAAQLQAGAVGSNFRGGRIYETVPVIDGVNIKDPSAGYGIRSPISYKSTLIYTDVIQTNLILPKIAIEQMEIITGGFNAEYGNAQSAVINVITKEGGSEHNGRVKVNAAATSYVEKRYYYKNPQGEFVYYRDTFLPEFFDKAQPHDSLLAQGVKAPWIGDPNNGVLTGTNLHGYELDDYNRKEYEFIFSGPVPFTSDRLRYALSGEIVDYPQRRVSYNGDWFQGAFQGKLTYRLSPNYKLQFIGMGSWIDSRFIGLYDSKYPGGYYPGYGLIPPKPETEEYDFTRNFMGSLKWTHSLSTNTFYEVQINGKYNINNTKIKDWNDRDGDGDYNEFLTWQNIRIPLDPKSRDTEWKIERRFVTDDTKYFWVPAYKDTVWEGGYKFGVPGKSHWKEIWWLNTVNYEYKKEWRFLTGTHNEKELTPYPIREESESSLYTPVTDSHFQYYGDAPYYEDIKSSVIDIRTGLTSQVSTQHMLKVGVNFDITTLDRLEYAYIYYEEYKVKPWNIAAYFEDKMEFEGMIINLGLRLDYYHQGKDIYYPGDFSDPIDRTKEPGQPGYIKNPKKSQPFYNISPRLGVSHPITDNSVIHFSYGHFYQRPEYRYWYENIGYNFELSGVMGNPNLKPEKTTAYEIGLQQNMGDYLLGMTMFYKDINDLTDRIRAGTYPRDFQIYINRDWANVRGFELTLRKFFSHYFSGNLTYTYMIAKGNASRPWIGGEEAWRKLVGAQKAYSLDWDRRHTLNAHVTVSVPQWGDSWDGWLFGDWALNLLFTYGSPKPYTPPTRDPQPEYNTKRLMAEERVDLKLEKRFHISGNIRALLFLEGYNIFNRRNLVNFIGDITNYADVSWLEHTGSYEGRNMNPYCWGPRRHFRIGIGFEY